MTDDNDCITPKAVAQQTALCLLTTASAESSFASSQKKTLRKNKWAHQTLKTCMRSFLFPFPASCTSTRKNVASSLTKQWLGI